MIDFSDVKLFTTRDGRKISYEDLLRDVYENNADTKESIKSLVDELTKLIKTPADAMMVMAHVSTMIETKVKNDDLLVKIASIISRMIQRNSGKSDSPEWEISEEEKRQLLTEVETVLSKR